MKRFYEVEVSGSVRVEFDDEFKSNSDEDGRQWTLLDAHLDERRFEPGHEWAKTVLLSLAVILGVENRSLNTDGWADFPTYQDLAEAGEENPYDRLPHGYLDGHWLLDSWREVDSEGRTMKR